MSTTNVGASFTLALDVNCALGESPVWVPDRGLLIFVDITGRRLYRFDPHANRVEHVNVDEDIGCVAVARGGGYVAGMRSGIWLLNESGNKRRKLADNPEDHSISRFNDGRVDPVGRYLSGTLDESKKTGNAGLYRFDTRGLAKVGDGFMTSNGLAFSPDGRTLYFSDTPRFVVYRFDYDPATGEAANRREFIRLEPTATDRGRPDGAAVDADGKTLFVTTARDKNAVAAGGGAAAAVTGVAGRVGTAAPGPGGGVYSLRVEVPGLPNPLFDPQI
jgi:sugar lactone lactonase YvrE